MRDGAQGGESVGVSAQLRVITGYAQYFATPFSTVKDQFYELDAWVRKRLRCMKYKRISKGNNRRFPNKRFARMGLVSLYSFAQ